MLRRSHCRFEKKYVSNVIELFRLSKINSHLVVCVVVSSNYYSILFARNFIAMSLVSHHYNYGSLHTHRYGTRFTIFIALFSHNLLAHYVFRSIKICVLLLERRSSFYDAAAAAESLLIRVQTVNNIGVRFTSIKHKMLGYVYRRRVLSFDFS